MKATNRENSAVVEFTGKVQRIARVHQLGLKDRATPKSKGIIYPKRILLAINESDASIIHNLVVKHLSNNT